MLMWRLSANLMSNGTKKSSGRLLKNTCSTNWKHHPTLLLAYTFGPRTDETCRELLALLTPFNIGVLTSDDWGSYGREVPKDKHLTGKIFTQRIERNNLTLRTRIKRLARKTICFSRSVEIHEKVIGTFIEKHMFY
ncbi:Transposase [Shigella dysenteriae 1617]|uniref:Transposase n=1 Tax=Shigella dysenteriae 1617 TaxID=754093 RepID=A0A0A6ZWU1_SHIDY|nr:Transposase [Shigella dysenteriae 1617]